MENSNLKASLEAAVEACHPNRELMVKSLLCFILGELHQPGPATDLHKVMEFAAKLIKAKLATLGAGT